MTIDREYLTEILRDLIRIPSVNPSLAVGGDGEAQIANYLRAALERLGLTVEVFEPQARRASVLGRLAGTGAGHSLMLNGHTDTVGVDGMAAPFSAELREGRMYGRGAQDMKGSLAAMLAALKALVDAGKVLKGDVLFAGVADEEYGSLGTSDLVDRLRIANYRLDGAIVCEPTGLQIAAAHRGYVWMEVETRGRAAHGSRWWEGIDANRMMGRVLGGLDLLAGELTRRPAHPLVGPPSLHTPLLQGGSEMSIYARYCKLQIERRTVPGETPAGVEAEIQAVLEELARQNANFQASLKTWFDRPPFEAQPGSQLQLCLAKATETALAKPAEIGGVAFWTDAALLSELEADVLLIGPQGGGLHTEEEWVEIESCVSLAEILAGTILAYCA